MASKKKTPTLPEQLRKLADDIEEATTPRRPATMEEIITDIQRPGAFKKRLLARRARLAEQANGDSDGDGDDGAPSSPPAPTRRRRFH